MYEFAIVFTFVNISSVENKQIIHMENSNNGVVKQASDAGKGGLKYYTFNCNRHYITTYTDHMKL